MSKAFGAKCGHVKRRLNRGDHLNGELLNFALSVVEPAKPNSEFSKFCAEIANKLRAGTPLTDHEHHIMVDVLLLHARLASSPAAPDALNPYLEEQQGPGLGHLPKESPASSQP